MFNPKTVPMPIDSATILNAIEYTKKIVFEYYNKVAEQVDSSLKAPIFEEMQPLLDQLEDIKKYVTQRGNSSFFFFNDESEYLFVFNIVFSALQLYKMEMEKVKLKNDVKGFDQKISRVNELFKNLTNGLRNDLYLKYTATNGNSKTATKIFISYQQDYVKTACKIQDIIIENSDLKREDVFVAHRDIILSDEWRKQMIDQLDMSTHILALCTTSYQSSAFGNQEVGYAIAKHKKIAPIFWNGTERNRFGFLEGFQSLPEFADESNIDAMIKKILLIFCIKPPQRS